MEYDFDNFETVFERKTYSVLDLFGEVGGIIDFLLIFINVVVQPIQTHGFLLKAIQTLYMVKTRDESAIKKPKKV